MTSAAAPDGEARPRWRARLGRLARSPLFWVLVAAALMRLPGLVWGLPAADGWDDDGIAPRDFLVALAETYRPGAFFTYPPLHPILLGLLTAPGWIAGLVHAPSLAPPDVIAELTRVPYMTAFAVVARAVALVMGLGTIVCVGGMAAEVGGRRAGLFAAAAAALCATLTYYGQVSNLDGPYIFWAVLAAWLWMRGIARRRPRLFAWATVATAAAIATKDQAYAVFLPGLPLLFLAWFAADPWPRQNLRTVLPPLVLGGLLSVFLLALVDGALTNPTGFAARLDFLLGTASADHAHYARDAAGRLRMLADAWRHAARFYPMAALWLGVLGMVLQGARLRGDRARWAAGLLPLFAILSFTLAFDFEVLREEHRFWLPQAVFWAVYIGLAADRLAAARPVALGRAAQTALAGLAGLALYHCLAVGAVLLGDPRYEAERWMRAHVAAGDTIETYGQNAYLPRFPAEAVVTRVAPTPLTRRNPLPGVIEVEQPYETIEARRPRFIVVSAFWVWRYLIPADFNNQGGRVHSPEQRAWLGQTAVRHYFRDLHDGRLRYRLAHESAYASAWFPTVHIHQSTAEPIRIFERIDGSP